MEYDSDEEIAAAIVAVAKRLVKEGHIVGSAGNVSHRGTDPDTMLITPSSVDYEEMEPADVVLVDVKSCKVVRGSRNPSVEKHLHAGVYAARENVDAILHTHGFYSTALGVLRWELPPIVEEFVPYIGSKVKVAEYGMAGTEELAEAAVKALGRRNAVIVANHGNVCVGRSFRKALRVLYLVERTAKMYLLLRGMGLADQIHPLPEETIDYEKDVFDIMSEE